jgi:TRAP-type mannitol/chloroaromatic compound transport system substrate-binding protein
LSGVQKSQIDSVCGDNVHAGIAAGESVEFAALKELVAEGVEVNRFSPAIIDASRRAWQIVADDLARSDADFARIWAALSAFRSEYAIWRELNAPR